ncbi:hypothetical protein [Methanobrevibacter ruminantium]|uniref:hypothetical protein n=1 Tax=Methanobrevibacter ruminantium TaxID=83816 RepID=UPI003F03065C
MNFRTFRLTSKIDDNDMIEIEIDLDTIDDDEPTIHLLAESLDRYNDGLLCPHSEEFMEDYETDHLFLQCCWDMASEPTIPKLERVKYWIELID